MDAPSEPLEATPEGPNFFQVALAALTSLPSYESISEDLEALDEAIALDRKIEALEQRKRELDERRTAVTQDQDQRAAKTSASPGPGDAALAEGSHGL